MTTSVIPGFFTKPDTDTKLFSVDWSSELDTGIGNHVSVIDKIDTSSWAIDSGSPTSAISTPASGFDDNLGITWVTVSGGSEGDVLYLNNIITTKGACVGGANTPPQTLVRQMKIKIQAC